MERQTYPQRRSVKSMPLDHWDRERGYSHCTGYEVRLSDNRADWWYEYEDAKTGETFLAR